MKNFNPRGKIIFLFTALLFSSCFEHVIPPCRITKFYWEDQWHVAHYNSAGRLTKLIAPTSQVYFYYDASMKLEKAEIFTGGATPLHRFEFTQGPWGIVEINFYSFYGGGTEHNRMLLHYSSPTRVDSFVRHELASDGSIGFEGNYTLNYVNNNVSVLDAETTGVNTTYIGSKYDKKKNPFRALAYAVGNPVFFPVCRTANYPVVDYDISYLSLFSANNPLKATYILDESGVDAQTQTFANTYQAGVAKKIVWTDIFDVYTSVEDYAFEFECGHHHGHDED